MITTRPTLPRTDRERENVLDSIRRGYSWIRLTQVIARLNFLNDLDACAWLKRHRIDTKQVAGKVFVRGSEPDWAISRRQREEKGDFDNE